MLALAIANLSFLGLGVQPPLAEWGQMLVSALPYLEESPRQVILPGLALTIMVIGFNFFGEAVALLRRRSGSSAAPLRRRRKTFFTGSRGVNGLHLAKSTLAERPGLCR